MDTNTRKATNPDHIVPDSVHTKSESNDSNPEFNNSKPEFDIVDPNAEFHPVHPPTVPDV